MRYLSFLLFLTLLGCTPEPDAPPTPSDEPMQPVEAGVMPTLTRLQTGADSVLFIGIHPVDAQTVWISGTRGTYARTTDGGDNWMVNTVPNADTLQFRDVHAVDANTAYLLSIGPGASSRIYKTNDGGSEWVMVFENDVPDAFYDCMSFWDAEHGIAFSDAVDATFPIITTNDGGVTWTRVPADALPPALPGEGSFAASGTCLVTHGDSTAWFGTGASTTARVFKTTDRGQTWSMVETNLVSGAAAGIASLTFRDALNGAALGGNIAEPDQHTDNVAITTDGGLTWTTVGRTTFTGAVYGSSYVPGEGTTLVAVGPGGVDYSTDNGVTWANLDTETHWSVAFAGTTGWAIGPEGRVTRIDF